LTVGDLDVEGCAIFIRSGKFRKDRLLPIRRSTVAALLRYIRAPQRTASAAGSAPLFVSHRGGRLTYELVHAAFRRALMTSGVRDDAGRYPRIHDLRYTFAAHRLAGWYRDGRDVDSLLTALSTYLGHVDIEFTLLYLRPAAPLLKEAADRFEAACAPRTGDGESGHDAT